MTEFGSHGEQPFTSIRPRDVTQPSTTESGLLKAPRDRTPVRDAVRTSAEGAVFGTGIIAAGIPSGMRSAVETGAKAIQDRLSPEPEGETIVDFKAKE